MWNRFKSNYAKTRVGLMRHSASETGGSLAWYFRSLEDGLKKLAGDSMQFVRLQGYYTQLGLRQSQHAMDDFLTQCDVVLASTGGCIDHVIAPFYRRDELGLETPIIYNPLGEFPRGAPGFLNAGPRFRNDDSIIFSSTADHAIYKKLIKSMACATQVSHFGVDTKHFSPQPKVVRNKLRQYLGLPENAFLLLYVGRITAEKNVHGLINVFEKLVQKHDHVYLLLVGEVKDVAFTEFGLGPYDLKALFTENIPSALWKRIRFFGAVGYQEIPEFYSAADVFVNLTVHHDENFGFTQVEAMSCACPVVASDWGGIKDTVIEGETGFKVPTLLTSHGVRPDRYYACQLLNKLIREKETLINIGEKARSHVVESLNVNKHCKDIYALILDKTKNKKHVTANKNALAELGKALHQLGKENLINKKTNQDENATLFKTELPSYGIYKDLILPYSTRDVSDIVIEASSQLQISSPWYEIKKNEFRCFDPLWPFSIDLMNELQYLVLKEVDRLNKSGMKCSIVIIEKTLEVYSADEILDALNELLEKGVIIMSSENTA